MKKTILIFFLLAIANWGNTQAQLENGNFEDWENEGEAEEEPVNWSSLKTADALAGSAPEVISQVTGRNGGSAVKMEVILVPIVSIKANGIMTNGRVHADYNPENGYVFTDQNDPKWNTEFTDRPDSIVGWYKYAPEAGDSGKIEITLHTGAGRLPVGNTGGNVIGRARYDIVTPQTDWTRFAKEFEYSSPDTPEYILTTIAAGDSTISNAGTELLIDDLELIYNETPPDSTDSSASVATQEITDFAINGSKGILHFGVKENQHVTYTVVDLTGKVIQEGEAKQNVPFQHERGIYIINVKTVSESFSKKVYIK